MGTFKIAPHMRLQEWIADEKGYFTAEGLDYELIEKSTAQPSSVQSAAEVPKQQLRGAYQTIEAGRGCQISSACHWTINMAAAAGHGRLWADAYAVSPCGIYVAPDSAIKRPADLADVPITVGYQSGSHYATIQAMEPILQREEIKLHFGGLLFQRLELLIEGKVPAATLFNGPMYFAEQLGFRKIIDCTFVSAALVPEQVDREDVLRYYRALKRAQQDLDMHFERYTHYYKKEFPQRFHERMDTYTFGPGERIVFLPYTKEIYEETQRWIEQWNIFAEGLQGRKGYDASVAHAVAQ